MRCDARRRDSTSSFIERQLEAGDQAAPYKDDDDEKNTRSHLNRPNCRRSSRFHERKRRFCAESSLIVDLAMTMRAFCVPQSSGHQSSAYPTCRLPQERKH